MEGGSVITIWHTKLELEMWIWHYVFAVLTESRGLNIGIIKYHWWKVPTKGWPVKETCSAIFATQRHPSILKENRDVSLAPNPHIHTQSKWGGHKNCHDYKNEQEGEKSITVQVFPVIYSPGTGRQQILAGVSIPSTHPCLWYVSSGMKVCISN